MEVKLVGFGAAAGPELADHRQAYRQAVTLAFHAGRGRAFGRLLDQPSFREPEEDGVGIVGRQEAPALRRGRDGRSVAVVGSDENSVKLGALFLAAFDAKRDAVAELVELADLDRRAERA